MEASNIAIYTFMAGSFFGALACYFVAFDWIYTAKLAKMQRRFENDLKVFEELGKRVNNEKAELLNLLESRRILYDQKSALYDELSASFDKLTTLYHELMQAYVGTTKPANPANTGKRARLNERRS